MIIATIFSVPKDVFMDLKAQCRFLSAATFQLQSYNAMAQR
jgi:hypothetical protein